MLRFITLAVLIFASSLVSAQTQCIDVFSNVVATFNENNGDIRFRQNASIVNSDGTIDFRANRIAHDNNASNTCGNQLCAASGNFAEALDLPSFMFTNSNTDVTVPDNSSGATIVAGEYDTVTVTQGELLSFVSPNDEYIIDELILQQGAVANFAPGDYWVDDLRMSQGAQITTNGDGLVRLFVTDIDDRNSNVRFINQGAQINPNQSSRNFLIVSFDDFRFSNQAVTINAHLYSVDDAIIGAGSSFTGSIVVGDALELQSGAQVIFDNQTSRELSFGDLCDSNVLVANYEFEEVEPVADTANNNDGTLVGDAVDVRLSGASIGQTCSVLDVPLNQSIGNNDGFDVPVNIEQQLGNEGTISFWYRSDVQWDQEFGGLDRKLFDASLAFGNQDDNEDKFFFLVLQNNGSLLFGLEDQDDNNGRLVSARFGFAADEWVHIAATWNVENQQMALFINGAPAVTGFIENALSEPISQTSTLRLGDNRSSYLPNVGTSPNSGDGQFDALRLYNFAQSAQQVDDDRIETDVSNCGAPLDAIAFYQFQPSEVPDDSLDFSDGALVGSATGVVLPLPTNVCGVLDVPLNQSAAPSDAFNTRVNIGETMGNRGTISFWYRSDEDWNLSGSGLDRKLFDASIPFGNGNDNEDRFFFLTLQNDGRLLFGFEDPNDNNTRIQTAVQNFSANEWVHVATTWDAVTQQATIFLNGAQAAAAFLERNAFGSLSETNTLFIGDNRSTYLPAVGTTPNSSNGQFDEVRLYRFDQTSAQVLVDINAQPPGCFDDILVDHYRLNYNASFTCAASEVNVQACANDRCDVLATSNSSLTIIASDNGSFNITNLTFAGSTVSELSADAEGIVTIGANNLNPNAEVRCFDNNIEDASCGVTFNDVGLTVSYGDDQNVIEIPDTISQIPFDTEIIVGVDQAGVCDAELTGRSLDIAVQCNDPNSCNSGQLRVDGSIVDDIEAFRPTGINFDANGQARIPANFLQYRDAGQIELMFRDEQNEAAGSSNPFVVRPILIAINRPNARNVAGEQSSLLYEALGVEGALTPNYNPSDLQIQVIKTIPEQDVGNPGVLTLFRDDDATPPDPGIPFSTNEPDEAEFRNVDEAEFDFMGNVPGRSNELRPEYSEVGTFTLLLRDEDYLGSGSIDAASIGTAGLAIGPITLGPYIPAYFEVENNTPSLIDTCNVPQTTTPFSYIGQNISFDNDLEFTVSAFNARGVPTLNYGGDLWRLEITETNEQVDTVVDGVELRGGETAHLRILSSIDVDGTISGTFDDNGTEDDFDDGEATYTLTMPVATHIKTAMLQPEVGASFDIQFGTDRNNNGTPDDLTDDTIQIVDEDGVCFQTNFPDGCSDFAEVVVQGATLRYGRLVIENAFGPETEALNVPFRTEYYDGDINTFVVNTDDNCTNTVFPLGGFGAVPPLGAGDDFEEFIASIDSEGTVFDGRNFPFEGVGIPAPPSTAQFLLFLRQQDSVDPFVQPWQEFLNFDWNGDGTIRNIGDEPGDPNLDMPSGLISFGVFRGNDRIIHWREVFNQ